jgi:hypothetical protein
MKNWKQNDFDLACYVRKTTKVESTPLFILNTFGS